MTMQCGESHKKESRNYCAKKQSAKPTAAKTACVALTTARTADLTLATSPPSKRTKKLNTKTKNRL